MNALTKFNQVMSRIYDAEIYMDKPYNDGLTGIELEKAIKERERYVVKVSELMKEAHRCMKQLSNV